MYAECRGDICQWSSNLYQCFVQSQMTVPEGLWEIMARGKQRDAAADEHLLIDPVGIWPQCSIFCCKPHHTALDGHIFHSTLKTKTLIACGLIHFLCVTWAGNWNSQQCFPRIINYQCELWVKKWIDCNASEVEWWLITLHRIVWLSLDIYASSERWPMSSVFGAMGWSLKWNFRAGHELKGQIQSVL